MIKIREIFQPFFHIFFSQYRISPPKSITLYTYSHPRRRRVAIYQQRKFSIYDKCSTARVKLNISSCQTIIFEFNFSHAPCRRRKNRRKKISKQIRMNNLIWHFALRERINEQKYSNEDFTNFAVTFDYFGGTRKKRGKKCTKRAWVV